MTQIQKLTHDIFIHLEERGWHKPKPGPLAKSIIIEAAELLEHFQWSEHDADKIKANPEKLDKISSELADVLIYCLQLSEVLGLDPDKIIRNKLKKVAEKYPANQVLGNDAEYWKLKKEARES
jgi:dCTP diphosphatase